MSIPYLHKCAKCGVDWWDAHVCAQDVKVAPMPRITTEMPSDSWINSHSIKQLPDCRTCAAYHPNAGCTAVYVCTNADQYRSAPFSALWKGSK